MPKIELFNGDCMEYMKTMPDKCYELCIVDPPYGIGIGASVGGGKPFGSDRGKPIIMPKIYRGFNDSVIPDKKYFQEITRVTKNQIIWGGNYFIEHLKNTPCFIVWDKDNSGNFADCELAWTSFKTATRKFKWRWNGMLQEDMSNKEARIHPTQKPVKLYEWLLKNYAKPGDRILDTHGGSFSSAIACYNLDFDYTGYELDKEYFDAGKARLEEHMKQTRLFDIKKPDNL